MAVVTVLTASLEIEWLAPTPSSGRGYDSGQHPLRGCVLTITSLNRGGCRAS